MQWSAKKGSLAYDTSKAAANHLVRELAIELAPLVRVNAVAPATVVKGSTMFPRDVSSLRSSSTKSLSAKAMIQNCCGSKLAAFYASALSRSRQSSPRIRPKPSSCLSHRVSQRPQATLFRWTAATGTGFLR
jgi:NAD(P)-dependent dehydrogenase (short-subunit alcohol dehydrogenase family)